ncbi:hypothetical protein ACTXT7_011427 [Hymenolepis weldensis]
MDTKKDNAYHKWFPLVLVGVDYGVLTDLNIVNHAFMVANDNSSCPLATQSIIKSVYWFVNSKTALLTASPPVRSSFLGQHRFPFDRCGHSSHNVITWRRSNKRILRCHTHMCWRGTTAHFLDTAQEFDVISLRIEITRYQTNDFNADDAVLRCRAGIR